MFPIFLYYKIVSRLYQTIFKGGSRHRDCFMARALGFLIRYFSNYYTLHRSDLAARAAPLDPRLILLLFEPPRGLKIFNNKKKFRMILNLTGSFLIQKLLRYIFCFVFVRNKDINRLVKGQLS